MNTHISALRLMRLIYMLLMIVLLTILAACLQGKTLGETVALCFLSASFDVVLTLHLELNRLHSRTALGTTDDFRLFIWVFVLLSVGAVGASFLPEQISPVWMLPLLYVSIFGAATGFAVSMYGGLLCAMLGAYSVMGIVSIVLTMTFTALIAALPVSKGKSRHYIGLSLIGIALIVPSVCTYLSTQRLNLTYLPFLLLEGVLAALLYILFGERLSHVGKERRFIRYETILDDSYHLLREIYAYSRSEYEHARKVADICGRVANRLSLNDKLAAAGGFYYRLGRMLGEPYIENGVRVAEENCFPTELVHIIAEYNALEHLPSSKESALVHIVDCVAIKFEVLDHDTFAGGWNREIVIYQTMNEQSQTGIYDASGLSMNEFLKIRDCLVEEGLL